MHIVLLTNLYDADQNHPVDYGGPVSPLVEWLKNLPFVSTVLRSRLYSIQTNILPETPNETIVVVDMELRYEDGQEFLKEHNQRLVEFHKSGSGRQNIIPAEWHEYTDTEDLIEQITSLGQKQ